MEDVRRWDRQVYLRELVRFKRVVWGVLGLGATYVAAQSAVGFWLVAVGAMAVGLIWAGSAYVESCNKRFRHMRFKVLWEHARQRLIRFDQALLQTRKAKVAEFEELPKTVRSVGEGLYIALRRADVVFSELLKSEGPLIHPLEVPPKATPDTQANELYRVADRNVAEYRQQVRGVLAGVDRTEAQVAVFISTLDTLRVKLLSYRLTGKSPELSSKEFLESIVEAKMQFASIDKALEELELTPWPTTIAAMPPPLPDDSLEEELPQQGGER